MDDIDILTLKHRTIKGIAAMASGTFILQIITFASQFTITILLSPSVFGIFAILSAGVAVLTYFSDIGLAAALIQKKDSITEDDLKTTFTIQQGLILILVIIGFVVSQPIASFYQLNNEGLWLFRALVISFFLASLKTIPTILLERSIQFNKITIVSIAEALVFYLSIISMAFVGFTIESFTVAVLFRGIVGLTFMYILSPWKPKLGISKTSAKQLLSFGVPMQANSLLALVKDNLFLLYLGKALTYTEVGYYGWGKSWSEVPLRLVMDSFSKVMFPAYARLQHDKEALKSILEKSLFFQTALIFPVSIGFAFLIHPLVLLIPKYEKWEPALPLFYFFILTSLFASIAVPLTHVLNATGHIKKTLSLMIFWTTLTWTFTPLFITYFGYVGAAIAASIVGLSSLITIIFVKRIVPFSLSRSILSPLIGSIILCFGLFLLQPVTGSGVIGILFTIVCGAVLYSVSLYILERKYIKTDIQFVKKVFTR